MKKIGKQVCMLATGNGNPRNGEGAFLRLKDGRILYAFARYQGNNPWDEGTAEIAGIYSCDEGETWSEPTTLFEKDDAVNNQCVNLLRLQNGDIAIVYSSKHTKVVNNEEQLTVRILMRVSKDESKTFSNARTIIDEGIYFVLENDRVIRLKNGRILLPINYHEWQNGYCSSEGKIGFYYSDDDGQTWLNTKNYIRFPATKSKFGLQETGVYEFENGELWAFSRTGVGCQYQCFSKDSGMTWTYPEPSEVFTSPLSPMSVKRVGKYVIAVLNPVARSIMMEYDVSILGTHNRSWGRTPLVCAVSVDDGRTFRRHDDIKSKEKVFFLEDDFDNGYCYTAIFAGENYFLAGYYHSNNSSMVLNSNKIIKVYYEELEQE